MNDYLDRYLVLKYPKLFVDRYKSPIESCLSFGIECNDGWFWLINNLCDSIQSYIDNNSKKIRIKNKFARIFFDFIIFQKHSSKFKFVRMFLQKHSKIIYDYIDKFEKEEYETIPQVKILQVKEKFGTLRFYHSGGNEKIDGMVWLAEVMSYNICEQCGSTKNIGRTKGWITTLCEDCSKKTPAEWIEIKEDPNFLRKLKIDLLNNLDNLK